MATLEQIANALRRADEAGDVEAARRLAQAYRAMQGQAGSEQAGFLESFRESALGLTKAPEAAAFAAAEPGTDEARKALLEAQRPRKETTSWEEVKDLASAWDWAKQTAGTSAGYLVAPAVLAQAGKMLTKAPGAAKALGYGTLGAQYLIDNLSRQAATQEEDIQRGEAPEATSLAKAGASAVGQAALDAVGIKFFQPLFGRFPVLKNLLGEAGEKTAKEAEDALIESMRNGTLRSRQGILTGAAKGIAFEVPQEIGQTMLERAQAGLSLTGDDARREYYEAMAGAVLLGAPLGGMSRYYENQQKLEEAQQIQLAREIKREEERQKADAAEKEAAKAERETRLKADKEAKKVKVESQLDAARGILLGLTTPEGMPVTAELESGEFERTLIKQGYPANIASRLIKSLEREGVLTPRNATTGVRSIVPEAKQYDFTKGLDTGVPAPPPPIETAKPDRISESIMETGAASDFVKDLYSPDPVEAVLTNFEDLDTVTPKEINQSKEYIKSISQNLLRNEFGDEVTLYRGLKGTEDKSPVLSYSLDKNVAKFQAEQQGIRTGKIEEIKVPVSEVLSYSEAVGRGTFEEAEVIIPANARRVSAPPAAPPPTRGPTDVATGEVTAKTDLETGRGSLEQLVPRSDTTGPGVADVEVAGMGDIGRTIGRVADGERILQSPLVDLKLENWQQRFEQTKSRFAPDDPESPINLLDRINRLKTQLPAGEDLNYVNEIQDVVSYLKKGTDLETIADKLGMDMSKLESYLNDLRQPLTKEETQGIIDENNKPIPEAFASKKTEQGRKIPSAYERFLLGNETPLVTVNRSLDDLIEKYDAEDVINNTGELRGRIRERLDQIENAIADDRTRRAARRATEAERTSVETETELKQREAVAKARAQGRMESAEQTAGMGPIVSTELAKANVSLQDLDQQVRNAVAQKDPKRILDSLYDLNDRIGESIPVGEAVPPAVERVRKVPKTMTKGQRAKLIRKLFEKSVATTERAKKDVLPGRESPAAAISERGAAKRRIDTTKSLIDALRKIDLTGLTFELEGEEGSNAEAFEQMRKTNRLAEYDPQNNVIRVRPEGVKQKTILHEMVHAVTVKVLRQYEVDPTSLPENQQEAVEHINKIYALASKKLRPRYPNAFENVYEFVSYAMTDNAFQKELSELRSPNLAKYASRAVMDLWTQFVNALANLFDLAPLGSAEEAAQAEQYGRLEKELNDPNTSPARKNFLKQQMNMIRRERIRTREGNLLLETAGAFEEILSPPKGGVDLAPLPAKAAAPAEERQVKKIKEEYRARLDKKHPTDPPVRSAARFLKTHEGSEWLIRKFQNDRRPLKTLQDVLVGAGKLIVGEENFNNLYSLISLSSGNAFHVMTQYFQKDMHDVHTSIEAYAKARGLSLMDALSDLNLYMIALHEPERRLVKFLRTVPLDNTKLITFGGVSRTAAEHRRAIFNLLRSNTALTKDQALKLREFVELLAGYKNGQKVGNGYIDVTNGKSLNPNIKPGKLSDDINNAVYNVAGELTPSELDSLRRDYRNDSQKVLIDRMIKAMQNIQDNTKEQDRRANYWSQPVDNIVNFYNFKNYVPLKGRPNSQETEDESEYNYTGKRLSGELAETAQSFEGRVSDADNVIMQTLVDGAKSAMRAGRRDVTQAIKNMISQGLIEGKNLTKKPIPFADREKELETAKYKGDDKIYHYRPDGSVEVFQITDKRMLESIRRTYREKSPFIDMANRITSGIGQSHTRYNPAFHPYNFVRDVLTNAFTLGAELGPDKSLALIGQVSSRVAEGGMMKAAKISKLYAEGDVKGIQELAKKDPFAASIYEYLEQGGRVSYVQGLAIRGQIDELVRDINRGKWTRQKEKVDKWVDIWTDMFELTSRAAAYETVKSEALAKGMSEQAARQEAAAYAKNLANFEQVGEWGRQAGALYMFFRPAATGAVRAIDALTPALISLNTAIERLPEGIRNDPVALNRFKANFMKQKKNTQTMLMGLLGAGATLYMMAFMAADDDELGRNEVTTEDMSLWTRNLRLPLNFLGVENLKDTFLQLPWGFGLGSFGAMGAQVMGAAVGRSSLADLAANATTIALDSFLPLPVARFNPMDNFPAWLLDSLSPSVARPFLEYTMNVDTFGREIYNNRMSKYGDAYTGGRHVPELYNQAARQLFEVTNAQADVSPNTMYFFVNNYVDGVSRIIHNGFNTYLWAAGKKEFEPKRDLLFMDSFFGRKSSVDAREFAEVEKVIQEKEQRLRTVKDRPELLQRYLESNPNDPALVFIYNKLKNQQLKKIRAEINRVKAMDIGPDKELKSVKDRQQRLKDLELARDMTMRSIIDTFDQYGLEP